MSTLGARWPTGAMRPNQQLDQTLLYAGSGGFVRQDLAGGRLEAHYNDGTSAQSPTSRRRSYPSAPGGAASPGRVRESRSGRAGCTGRRVPGGGLPLGGSPAARQGEFAALAAEAPSARRRRAVLRLRMAGTTRRKGLYLLRHHRRPRSELGGEHGVGTGECAGGAFLDAAG